MRAHASNGRAGGLPMISAAGSILREEDKCKPCAGKKTAQERKVRSPKWEWPKAGTAQVGTA